LVLGILLLVWPTISIVVAAVLFGVYLLVSGIAQVVAAFGADESAGTRVLFFITGALSVVLAVLAFRNFGEGLGVLFLAIWIGVGFIFQGVSETVLGISYPDLPGRGWQIFLGVITVLAGMIVLASPIDSIVLLAIVTGICLIVVGIGQIVKALKLRSGIGRAAPAA
ncbi:HdeD family acid-resistance protein, partial [Mycolicibacterium sphagni]